VAAGVVGTVLQPDRLIRPAIANSRAPVFDRVDPKWIRFCFFTLVAPC
jgi:hypothetical protein